MTDISRKEFLHGLPLALAPLVGLGSCRNTPTLDRKSKENTLLPEVITSGKLVIQISAPDSDLKNHQSQFVKMVETQKKLVGIMRDEFGPANSEQRITFSPVNNGENISWHISSSQDTLPFHRFVLSDPKPKENDNDEEYKGQILNLGRLLAHAWDYPDLTGYTNPYDPDDLVAGTNSIFTEFSVPMILYRRLLNQDLEQGGDTITISLTKQFPGYFKNMRNYFLENGSPQNLNRQDWLKISNQFYPGFSDWYNSYTSVLPESHK